MRCSWKWNLWKEGNVANTMLQLLDKRSAILCCGKGTNCDTKIKISVGRHIGLEDEFVLTFIRLRLGLIPCRAVRTEDLRLFGDRSQACKLVWELLCGQRTFAVRCLTKNFNSGEKFWLLRHYVPLAHPKMLSGYRKDRELKWREKPNVLSDSLEQCL